MIYIIAMCSLLAGQTRSSCSIMPLGPYATAEDCKSDLANYATRNRWPLEYHFGSSDRVSGRYECLGRPTWILIR